MITRLGIKNFKSIGSRRVNVELKPLVIFVGPNGSGKSSILQAIDWLATKTEKPRIADLSNHNKAVYGVDSLEDLIHKGRPSEVRLSPFPGWSLIRVELKLRREHVSRISRLIRRGDWGKLGLRRPKLNVASYTLAFAAEAKEVFQELSLDGVEISSFRIEYDRDTGTRYATYLAPQSVSGKVEAESKFEGHARYADHILHGQSFALLNHTVKAPGFRRLHQLVMSVLRDRFLHVHLISPQRGRVDYRGSPEKLKEKTSVGKFGENVVEMLGLTIGGSDEKMRAIGDKITFWASNFGLDGLTAGMGRGATLRSSYTDQKLGTGLSSSFASHGSKQALAFITQLCLAPPGSTIMIEEPEISLHPGYQAKLPLLFAEAVNEGKQVLITTHSALLPLALSYAIRGRTLRGWIRGGETRRKIRLNRKDVAVYHVTRGSDGCTKVERLKLTKKGFVEGGVPSFARVERELYRSLFKGKKVE